MWPFKKKRESGLPSEIPYKSPRAFFESQCKYGYTELAERKMIVGIVLDARQMFGTSVAVKVNDDGTQLAALRIAAPDGGFIVIASTVSSRGERLAPNDLVVWEAGLFMTELAERSPDRRTGWAGLIIAKIAPVMRTVDNELTVICDYRGSPAGPVG